MEHSSPERNIQTPNKNPFKRLVRYLAGDRGVFTRDELVAIDKRFGPAASIAVRSIHKKIGYKITVGSSAQGETSPEDQARKDKLDKIAMANAEVDPKIRVKQAKKLGYTVVGIPGASIIGK